jgi:two-component system NtrC family sensor kinase
MPGGASELGPEFLARVAASLGSRSDQEAGLLFLDLLEEALPVRAWLACRSPETEAVSWARTGGGEPFPLRLSSEQGGLLRGALLNGCDAVIADPLACPECPEKRYLQRGGGSWAFLAATAAGQPVGCLILRSEAPATLPERLLATAKSALTIVALALEVSRLHRELEARVEERTREISLLYDVSRSLGFVLSPEDLVQLVAGSLGRALSFDLCAMTLQLPDHRRISVHLSCPAEELAVIRLRGEITAQLASLSGSRPEGLELTLSGPEVAGGSMLHADDFGSVAHAPLVIRGQVVGLISVVSREKDAFGPALMRLVYTIASQASLTLDRIRTAREAEASKIHSMLESMAQGVLLLDRDLRIVMINPAAQSYLGTLEGDVPATLHRIGDVPLLPLIETLDPTGSKPMTFEAAATAEGRIFSITCSPVRGLDEKVQGVVVVISDVTEARMLQLQFAQAEKLSALGEMISGVAHELNNPLASVMGYAQLLQTEPVDETVRRKLSTIGAEAGRCQRIVQNLLRFARRHTPEQRPLDIHVAVDSVLQLLGHQLRVDDITVDLDLQPGPRVVVGDFHLLQQVFLNIIYNAYQAMKEKGGAGRLIIRTRNPDGRVVVEIIDDGPGIPPQNLKRIFDPFFSTKEVGQGTGLGLSLAYGTVREHGGTITARSAVGSGSTFTVELPAAPPGTAAVEESPGVEPAVAVEGPDVEPDPEGRMPPRPTATGRRILVVEDELSLADVMAEALQAQGHRVDTACDGRSARALIATARYDVIICDLKMPNMNGRDFYRHVVSIEPALARRIIFSTGDTASPDTQLFFEEVGNPFLAKPFNLKDLFRVVDSVLGAS